MRPRKKSALPIALSSASITRMWAAARPTGAARGRRTLSCAFSKPTKSWPTPSDGAGTMRCGKYSISSRLRIQWITVLGRGYSIRMQAARSFLHHLCGHLSLEVGLPTWVRLSVAVVLLVS